MKRVNDYFVPSITEIKKAIQHYNRINNGRSNFHNGVRYVWWKLYWDFEEGHFIWRQHCNSDSFNYGYSLRGIRTSDSPDFIRADLLSWITGVPF